MARVVGPGGDRAAQAMVAAPSARRRNGQGDATGFSALASRGRDAGFGGELVGNGEALPRVAEFGEDLRGVEAAGAR